MVWFREFADDWVLMGGKGRAREKEDPDSKTEYYAIVVRKGKCLEKGSVEGDTQKVAAWNERGDEKTAWWVGGQVSNVWGTIGVGER